MTTFRAASERDIKRRTPTRLERAGQRIVRSTLSRITHGSLTVQDGEDTTVAGDRKRGPHVTVRIQDPVFYKRVLIEGTAGAAESYIDGEWTCDDLAGLFELLLINRDALESTQSALSRTTARIAGVLNTVRRNSRRGSTRNIRAHYDLSNEFFALWLDPSMLYSAAYFEHADMSLEDAQLAKVDRCCSKLDLAPSDRLLEIGTGWGGAAIRAAEHFGCRVVTTTISDQQFQLATARVRERGLQDRVSVVRLDYRDLEREYGRGSFNKILSIEMIEAVGHEYLPRYFQTISRMLTIDGLAVIQGIWIRDQRYDAARRTVDFLKRRIFPGSCLLGLTAVSRAVRDNTDLSLIHMDDMAPHYVRTLQSWNRAFHARVNEIRSLGFDDRFIRMWRYYFEYCEGAFRARHCGDYQFVLAKPLARPRINSCEHA
ncbi:MAG: class I SAM-dependent methyltransferase [Phycisphaeraceae bacterium]|nr:class I SAM-dependent methyltransferase [Phycisphaeraceae bacterium]